LDFENVFSTQNNTNRFKEIGLKYGCDKVSRHRYHEIYPDVFEKYQNKEINLFEIGIDEGKSLKVWKEYYPNCNVFGMDIQNEIANEDVTIFKGDQSNLEDLNNIISKIPKCDVIIDDGSHVAEHQLKTFYHLFEHLLNDGGTYIIEDIECSYWKPSNTIYNYETGHLNIIDYFTKLNHQVNSNYNSTDNHLRIKQITFFPNCIILKKEVL
jgi:23S rRNA U2552 (ribose-2'-O)-methylase RlmE/FtsJ